MIVIGLTGSIGMGKSTAAGMLKEMGVPVHDSDAAVHLALGPQGCGVDAVAAAFPAAYDTEHRSIDRKILGSMVFKDAVRRKELEDILHPMVRAMQQDFLKANREKESPAAVLDIPLLYETGAEKRVDKVIVVTCPSFIQRRRVLSRPGMTAEKFNTILSSQTPDAEKKRRADFVVQTGLGRTYTKHRLKTILNQLLAGAQP